MAMTAIRQSFALLSSLTPFAVIRELYQVLPVKTCCGPEVMISASDQSDGSVLDPKQTLNWIDWLIDMSAAQLADEICLDPGVNIMMDSMDTPV